MSQANVDLAKSYYAWINEAYGTGDWGRFERHAEAACAPDLVVDPGEAGLFTEGEWRGREQLIKFVKGPTEALDDMWVTPAEFIDVDDETVVVPLTFGGRARHTGIAFEQSQAQVITVRDGKAVRVGMYRDKAAALEAAGLRE
jgi:ketosteroid isomerase-like protein